MKRLYDWVIHWADTPYAVPALFLLAFAESSFFPIPPDALLIVMCLGLRKKSFHYALACTVGSVLGGMFGYFIGYHSFEWPGKMIFTAIHGWDEVGIVASLYSEKGAWALAAAGFTPIPYKVFTILTGLFDSIAAGKASFPIEELKASLDYNMDEVNRVMGLVDGLKQIGLGTFVIISSISRSLRFFLVAGLIFAFGDPIKTFIEKYFNILTIVFLILLVLGFVVIKYIFQ